MKHRYLEITFRRGKPFGAYLYLPRNPPAKAASTVDEGRGLLVDFDRDRSPMGIEITAPALVTIADVNAILGRLGLATVPPSEWAPLRAA
jgi:hypothetical protein